MAKVLITSEYFSAFSNEGKQILVEAGHDVIDNPFGHKNLTAEEIIPIIQDAEAIICDLEPINKVVLAAAGKLKVIARRGVGVDSVDLKTAAQKGILTMRTLGLVEQPAAELVIAFIFALSRQIPALDASMKNHAWSKLLGDEVGGKRLGIVGMGNIATQVARLATGIGMKVAYFDIVRNKRVEDEFQAEYNPDLNELLAKADFVSLHCTLNEHTRHLINQEKLSGMKKSAFLINTARGAIVNENDLAAALKNKVIAGAAIDVFQEEPPANSPLCSCENAILTPHVATFTKRCFIKMDIQAAENVKAYFDQTIAIPENYLL